MELLGYNDCYCGPIHIETCHSYVILMVWCSQIFVVVVDRLRPNFPTLFRGKKTWPIHRKNSISFKTTPSNSLKIFHCNNVYISNLERCQCQFSAHFMMYWVMWTCFTHQQLPTGVPFFLCIPRCGLYMLQMVMCKWSVHYQCNLHNSHVINVINILAIWREYFCGSY